MCIKTAYFIHMYHIKTTTEKEKIMYNKQQKLIRS